MYRCVFLSMDNLDGYGAHDQLLIQPLAEHGWQVDTISWHQPNVDWNTYDLVIVRTTWDYQNDVPGFLKVLQQIEQSSAHLDNPLSVIRWNINKHYLRELERKGILIIPTLWRDNLDTRDFAELFGELATQQLVVKPCVSVGSIDTFRINTESSSALLSEIASKFQQRALMIQPFVESIITQGEFSMFYFDGEFSHCVNKKPKQHDFRVQEEYGGQLTHVKPQPELLQQADKVMRALEQSLLYARLDFVVTASGYALIEAELIEPSLYFKLDPESPQRFVHALQRRMRRLGVIKS